MRTSQLRSLLATLRAGGVSEYSETKRGTTTTIKLSPSALVPAKDPSAKAAKVVDTEAARKRQEMLDELAIDEAQLAKAMEGIQ